MSRRGRQKRHGPGELAFRQAARNIDRCFTDGLFLPLLQFMWVTGGAEGSDEPHVPYAIGSCGGDFGLAPDPELRTTSVSRQTRCWGSESRRYATRSF